MYIENSTTTCPHPQDRKLSVTRDDVHILFVIFHDEHVFKEKVTVIK